MIRDITKVLFFEAFRPRNDDPQTHFSKKVGKKPFMVAVLGTSQSSTPRPACGEAFWNSQSRSRRSLRTIQNAEQDSAWAVDMNTEAGDVRKLLIGVNCMFSNLKMSPKDAVLKDIEKALKTKP